ncbi:MULTISPECIES: hypothetical protein [unclassified Acinetobacter]|uniref:hypothetical protein n=1 Tax=unclassified Acinetobacter TaxID=196816 RepID=UPI0015D134EA|nr:MULTISPECIES: hypothetical protein [unclassified Acinetobacter]UUS62528.1 hypothetical protein MST17_16600 [Acinetobacter sp. YH16056_T]
MKKYLTVFAFILVGCSKPATPEEISTALNECPGIEIDIRSHTKRAGMMRFEPKIIKKSDLRGWVKDCQKKRSISEDPNSEENIIRNQQRVIGDY